MIQVGALFKDRSYSGQLEADEWRSFSRIVRETKGNACEVCRRSDVPIQVHHLFYDGRKLWEYSLNDVILLCNGCHKELHTELKNFRKHVFRYFRPEHLRVLNGALQVAMSHQDPLEFVYAIAELASSPSSVKRFANAWNPHLGVP